MSNQERSNLVPYFAELTLHLRRESLTALPPEDGLLPGDLDGRRLCRITPSGGVMWVIPQARGVRPNSISSYINMCYAKNGTV